MPERAQNSTIAKGRSCVQLLLVYLLLLVVLPLVRGSTKVPAVPHHGQPRSAPGAASSVFMSTAPTATASIASALQSHDLAAAQAAAANKRKRAIKQTNKQNIQKKQQQEDGKDEQTPAQKAASKWFERQKQRQQLLVADTPVSPPPKVPAAGTPPPPGEFYIPVPPPGTDVPAEVQMPLYSPDQLRLRHKLIPGIALESQIISLGEQMQQAAALSVTLTKQQLEEANPLLGANGPINIPEKAGPSEYPDGYLALCVIVKDQHRDLREWLEYHRWLGIKKVYIYDNNSTVPLASHIADFMHSGFVEYAFFSGMQRYRNLFRTSSQWWAYNDCIHRYRHRHRWLGFIDADEFIVLQDLKYDRPSWQEQQQQQHEEAARGGSGSSSSNNSSAGLDDINTFMHQYELYGGLALNWVIFGSSGHQERPPGGVLVNYHACLPSQHEQNTHVKVIANTKYLMTVGDDPHRVYYKSPQYFTVNELGQRVPAARTATPSHSKIALYHYLTKSSSEYMQKMRRGSAAGNYKSAEFFQTINSLATSTCTKATPLGLKCCPSVLTELGQQGVKRVQAHIAAMGQQQPDSMA